MKSLIDINYLITNVAEIPQFWRERREIHPMKQSNVFNSSFFQLLYCYNTFRKCSTIWQNCDVFHLNLLHISLRLTPLLIFFNVPCISWSRFWNVSFACLEWRLLLFHSAFRARLRDSWFWNSVRWTGDVLSFLSWCLFRVFDCFWAFLYYWLFIYSFVIIYLNTLELIHLHETGISKQLWYLVN
jgi:hypothetical protein